MSNFHLLILLVLVGTGLELLAGPRWPHLWGRLAWLPIGRRRSVALNAALRLHLASRPRDDVGYRENAVGAPDPRRLPWVLPEEQDDLDVRPPTPRHDFAVVRLKVLFNRRRVSGVIALRARVTGDHAELRGLYAPSQLSWAAAAVAAPLLYLGGPAQPFPPLVVAAFFLLGALINLVMGYLEARRHADRALDALEQGIAGYR